MKWFEMLLYMAQMPHYNCMFSGGVELNVLFDAKIYFTNVFEQ